MYDQLYTLENESESEGSDSESELEDLASLTVENMMMKKGLTTLVKCRQVGDRPKSPDKITVSKESDEGDSDKESMESDSESELESLASLTVENMMAPLVEGKQVGDRPKSEDQIKVSKESDESDSDKESRESDSESELESLASLTVENMKKGMKGRQISDRPRNQNKIIVSKEMEYLPSTKYSKVLSNDQFNLNFVIDKGPGLNLNRERDTFLVEDESSSEAVKSNLELDYSSHRMKNTLLHRNQKLQHLELNKRTVSSSSTITLSDLDKDKSDLNFIIDKSSNNPTANNIFVATADESSSDCSSDLESSNDIGGIKYNESNVNKMKEKMFYKNKPLLHKAKGTKSNKKPTSLQSGINTSDTYVNVDSYQQPELYNRKIEDLLIKSTKQDDLMKRSVITSDFEKKDTILPYEESLRQIRKQRQKEKAKTKGKNWFHMPATEMTESNKNDLTVLQMRRALDPKRFYKASDIRALPKYFQTGTVIESPADFYHSRVPKKQRKKTLVDELLADADFRKFNKRKYAEIVEAKKKGRGPYKHMKRLKKKKK